MWLCNLSINLNIRCIFGQGTDERDYRRIYQLAIQAACHCVTSSGIKNFRKAKSLFT